MSTTHFLELAIKRALNCKGNDFGGLISSSSLEQNAFVGLIAALAPFYVYQNYRGRIDDILTKYHDSISERYYNGSPELKEMADAINSLLDDIDSDPTINTRL
ncbi:hypothetical protein BTR23_11930 [Alkalihalophilus pseudofirmus]|nr:hypothetical protein BTR23_11930 [Alkalihalophilus pseudofirmus]